MSSYNNNQSNPRSSLNSNASGGSNPKRNYDEQTLIPVTIRMILNSLPSPTTQDSLTLRDGRDLHQVKFIGAVRTVEEQSTNVTFQIEDGTGLVDVKLWMDPAQDCPAATKARMEASVENCYVKVVGQVKEYDGAKNVIAQSVRRLGSGNELTHHLLEVVYSFEKHRRGGSVTGAVSAPQTVSSASSAYGGMSRGPSVPPPRPNQRFDSGAGGAANISHAPALSGGPAAVADVQRFITERGLPDIGADINECVSALAGRFDRGAVMSAVEYLAGEGIIYSTIDETKYCIAE